MYQNHIFKKIYSGNNKHRNKIVIISRKKTQGDIIQRET